MKASSSLIFKSHRTGVSLVEMLTSLAIFSIIVFPLIMLPIKAVDQTEELKNSGMLQFESDNFFREFHTDINLAHRFFPFNIYAAILGEDMPIERFTFMAYWNPSNNQEVRVGYQLREIEAGSGKWELLKAIIPANARLSDFASNSQNWKPASKILNKVNYAISGLSNTPPIFVYCHQNNCGTSANPIPPEKADSIRLQSGTRETPLGLLLRYRNATVTISPLFFKLASMSPNPDRFMEESQFFPFSAHLGRWNAQEAWIAEKIKNDPMIGNYRVPVESAAELATAIRLSPKDIHYNYRTGELLAVSNSDTNVTPTERGYYIFKFHPGLASYVSYDINIPQGGTITHNFPVVLHNDDPGALPFGEAEFLSVTQDSDDNIYVLGKTNLTMLSQYSPSSSSRLAQSHTFSDHSILSRLLGFLCPPAQAQAANPTHFFWIQRFSPEGQFLSRFNITANDVSEVAGIAFNSATPNEICALIKRTNGDFHIRVYPKDQNEDDPTRVVYSAQSAKLNDPAIAGDFTAAWNTNGVVGLEYDSLHQRYLTVLGSSVSTNATATLLSLDVQTGTNANERVLAVSNIHAPLNGPVAPILSKADLAPQSQSAIGVAFDPLNNIPFITTTENDSGNTNFFYYQLLPSRRLTIVYRQ